MYGGGGVAIVTLHQCLRVNYIIIATDGIISILLLALVCLIRTGRLVW